MGAANFSFILLQRCWCNHLLAGWVNFFLESYFFIRPRLCCFFVFNFLIIYLWIALVYYKTYGLYLMLISNLLLISHTVLVNCFLFTKFSYLINASYFINDPLYLAVHFLLINYLPPLGFVFLLSCLCLLNSEFLLKYPSILSLLTKSIWLGLALVTIFILYVVVMAYVFFYDTCSLLLYLVMVLLQ